MKAIVTITLALLTSFLVNAQDCGQIYTFNINDKTSYSTSCGAQQDGEWIVRKNSCNFYTPLTAVGGKVGDDDRWVDISVRLGNSGNLDEKDFAWIFYYVNGKTEVTKTIRGDQVKELYHFRDSIAVPAGGNFKLRIAYVCDGPEEFWKLTNGDLTTCIRKGPGELIEEEVAVADKITFSKEREIIKLMWSAPSGPAGNYFLIERSKNGTQYEFAGYVKDNRKAGATSNYSFIDGGFIKPETWYRITQVDMAGNRSVFGNPVAVKL